MKKEYEIPYMMVVQLCTEDVITASPDNGMGFDENMNGGGGSGGETGWDTP